MGKLVYTLGTSVDGFIERPDGDISWHRVDEELHWHMNEKFRHYGAFVSGRVTYEGMAAVWPTADTNPESTPAMVDFGRIVGSSRVDLQACKLEYSIVSPK